MNWRICSTKTTSRRRKCANWASSALAQRGQQEAYNELGYPGVDFDDTLVRAMSELLETPVVDGPIGLEQKVLSYAMTDETLEALSPAQKQLVRLGPKGVQAVHDKIRQVAALLGVASSRLPQSKAHSAVAR